MPDALEELIARANGIQMTSEQMEAQRRSFAYGNTNIENNRITKDSIAKAAETMNSNEAKENKG